MFSGLVLRYRKVSAVVKSLVQFSKAFDPSYDVSSLDAGVSNIPRDPAACNFIQDPADSSYRRYVGVTKLARRFPDTLRLLEKLNHKARSEDFRPLELS